MDTILREIYDLVKWELENQDKQGFLEEEETKSELTIHMKDIMNQKKIPVACFFGIDKLYIRYWGSRKINIISG